MGGPCPITLTEILSLCVLYEIHSFEERDKLIRFIQAMDGEWVKASSATNGTSEVDSKTSST